MTNDELDALTQRAENLSQSLDRLLLDGDGRFVRAADPATVVPASEILRMLTFAEREAHGLYLQLRDLPRRKVGQRKGAQP